MKKLMYLFMVLLLCSCGSAKILNQCQEVAKKELTDLDGYELERTSVNKTKGLKLAIPAKYEGAKKVALITYKSKNEDYKVCSCYYNGTNKMIGYKTKVNK